VDAQYHSPFRALPHRTAEVRAQAKASLVPVDWELAPFIHSSEDLIVVCRMAGEGG
jgi:hypothetical protein